VTQDLETSGRRRSGSNVPGDVLLLAHELWMSGQTSPAAHEDGARTLGISPEDFEAVREFHRRILSRPADEALVLCRGVSCRMHGADSFHAALKAGLDAAGARGKTMDVLCLSQCPHGPNVKLQQQILCSGAGVVIADERPWRPVTAGPKPVVDASPPSAT
jgi:NADH:ubiquinone oxidoreductase subunit E